MSEYQCPCAECLFHPERPQTEQALINFVEQIRLTVGRPIVVTSGVRCDQHNHAIGGASDSRHLPQYRDAVDLAVIDSETRYGIIEAVMTNGGISFVEIGAKHIHLDTRSGPFRLMWSEKA